MNRIKLKLEDAAQQMCTCNFTGCFKKLFKSLCHKMSENNKEGGVEFPTFPQ